MATCRHGNTHDVHCEHCAPEPGRPIEKTRARGQIINDLYAYAHDVDRMKLPVIGSTMREAARLLELDQPAHKVSECGAECHTPVPAGNTSHHVRVGGNVFSVSRIKDRSEWMVWRRGARPWGGGQPFGDPGSFVYVWEPYSGPCENEQQAISDLDLVVRFWPR